MHITDDQVASFVEHGYLVVPRFLSTSDIDAGLADFYLNFPSNDDVVANPAKYGDQRGYLKFPYPSESIMLLVTQPEVASFLERAIGTADLEIEFLDLSAKYGALNPGEDQFLHIDGSGEATFAYPRTDGIFRQIMIFFYLTDVLSDDLAPTYVVSQTQTRDEFLFPGWRKSVEDPEIYTYEKPILAPAGSIAAIDMSTFHRGSRMTAAAGYRFVVMAAFHAGACRWMQKFNTVTTGSWEEIDQPSLKVFMERATPRQRQFLGFPAPGHEYWNERTIAGVAARYPGMDMTPYREALLSPQT